MAGRHANTLNVRERTPPRVLAGVAALLGVVALAMVWLWPESSGPPAGDQSVRQVNGVIEAIDRRPCPDSPPEGQSSLSGSRQTCGTAQVRLTSGDREGATVTAQLPSGTGAPPVAVGDAVALAYSAGNPPESQFAIVDLERGSGLWVLFAAFVLSVVGFGRWRGVTSLLGLGFTFTVILGFVIPAILDGKPPLTVAIIGCAAIVLVVLYLTHGIGQATTIAVAGTIASLVLTGVLSVVAVRALNLSGAGDESSFLLGQSRGVDLRGLLLAGILIGSLGVLDDVTVTQTATVQELALANPEYNTRQLYGAAVRVGRSHIASVINTIVLAYAGASLPLIALISSLDDPVGQVLSDQLVATELVRSAVGTMGLIAAVPITTVSAAVLATRGRSPESRGLEPVEQPP